MDLLKKSLSARLLVLATISILLVPVVSSAEEYKLFKSEEYGFTLEFPGSWVKVDRPKANYYVVFQAPDLTDNFRNRIHVAAHEPVKDPLKVFLKELRNGIKDLQKKTAKSGQEAQQVRILDEGEFRCDVPGAYYFFIQAFEDKLNIWMDIVIVFYKHNQTLLRISCLAPSTVMEKMQPIFNRVLVSVRFEGTGEQPAAAPSKPAPAPEPRRILREQPAPVEPRVGEEPAAPRRAPAPVTQPEDSERQIRRGPAGPTPRGPARSPDRPSTGIIN